MIRRPAVTLMEVLIAMFIMAIGMLALLALFPVGAVSMAQALKDDRCASTAAMAENVAISMNVRHDQYVAWAFNPLNPAMSTSGLLYIDPYGVAAMPTVAPYGTPLGGVITRIAPSFVYPQPPPPPPPPPALSPLTTLVDRWFSLPDDITFLENGTPQTDGAFIDRGRRYSYAYLFRLLAPDLIQLYVVVYQGRPVNSLTAETPLAATVAPPPLNSTNQLVLNAASTTAKRGGWILSLDTGATNTFGTLGRFYRITNITEGAGTTTLETQQSFPAAALNQNITIVIMDYVAEVFDKGTSWQP